MRRLVLDAALVLGMLALAVALAFAAPPPAELPRGAVCVPPGLPPFSTWQPTYAASVLLLDSLGRPVLASDVRYSVGARPVRAIWVGQSIAALDPDTTNPDEPMWYDTGLMAEGGKQASGAAATCRWERVKPSPPPEDKT